MEPTKFFCYGPDCLLCVFKKVSIPTHRKGFSSIPSPTTLKYIQVSRAYPQTCSDLPRAKYWVHILSGYVRQISKKQPGNKNHSDWTTEPWDDRQLCLCWGDHHPPKLNEEEQNPSWFQHLLVEVSFLFPRKKKTQFAISRCLINFFICAASLSSSQKKA